MALSMLDWRVDGWVQFDFEADGNPHKQPFPNRPFFCRSRRFDGRTSYPHASRQHDGIPRFSPLRRQGPKRVLGHRPGVLCLETVTARLGCGTKLSPAF